MQKALEYVNSTESFLKDQIPDFINQYLTWCAFECIFYIVLFAILFLIPFITFLITQTKIAKTDFDYFGGPVTWKGVVWCASLVLSIMIGIIAAIGIPQNAYTLLKINKAPKVFLMENLAKAIRNHK